MSNFEVLIAENENLQNSSFAIRPTEKTTFSQRESLERPRSSEGSRRDHSAELSFFKERLAFLMSALSFLVSFLGQAKKEKRRTVEPNNIE